MKILKTGIAGLDELLKGGLPPKVLLLVGDPGSGVEVFVQQIAYKRAQQTSVSYITLNKPIEQIREEMSVFGFDTVKLEKNGNWRFISPSPRRIGEIIEGELCEKRSIVIDSLSDTLVKGEIDESISLLRNMSKLNRQVQELHFVLLTKSMHDPKDEVALQHFADGIIEFTTTHGTEYISRRMFIKKLGGVVTPTRSFPYTIGEKGILIETAMRIA
ncbi:MAG: RAD55 family ATPase [Candidatus Bathyarchaeia archaeon]